MIRALLVCYARDRSVRPSTLEAYRWCLRSYRKHLGHRIRTKDWNAQKLNRYLAAEVQKNSVWTARQRRATLVAIWREGHRQGLLPPPERLRTIRGPDRVFDTWDASQVSLLANAAAELRGCFKGTDLPRGAYMRSLLLAGWDTGLRQSDMHRLPPTLIQRDGPYTLVQQKTGFAVTIRLRPATREAAAEHWERMPADWRHHGVLWPRWGRRDALGRLIRDLTRQVGLTGTWTTLRKSSCTEVERIAPGLGWIHLGHRSPETTRQWYTNRARAYDQMPLPPAPDGD